jgi:2-oxoglutarate dehydrogenase complex dehydrogenase (E1) component-like enzyme
MSDLNDFTCKGKIHIVINNHIGFSTMARQLRSCTKKTILIKK